MPVLKTIQDIAVELTKREGKKKQVNIAQVTEQVSHLSDMVFEQIRNGTKEGETILHILYRNGSRRAKARKKV